MNLSNLTERKFAKKIGWVIIFLTILFVISIHLLHIAAIYQTLIGIIILLFPSLTLWYGELKYLRVGGKILMGGCGLIFCGGLINLFTMAVNSGCMPVLPSIYNSVADLPDYYVNGGKLLFLGDCYFGGFSIGDIVADLGFWVTVSGFIILSVSWIKGKIVGFLKHRNPSA